MINKIEIDTYTTLWSETSKLSSVVLDETARKNRQCLLSASVTYGKSTDFKRFANANLKNTWKGFNQPSAFDSNVRETIRLAELDPKNNLKKHKLPLLVLCMIRVI